MRSVGIKALKNQLSAYVKLAAEGEIVLICDRDKVVAELRAPQSGRSQRLDDAVLSDLIRHGLISPAAEHLAEIAPQQGRMSLADLLQGLDDDRSER